MTDTHATHAVQTAADGTPVRADGTPYTELAADAAAATGARFAEATVPAEGISVPADGSMHLVPAAVVPAEVSSAPPADPDRFTVDPEGMKILHIELSSGDQLAFVALPVISAYAELAVIDAQVTISENVERMKNSPTSQGNGRLAVEILTQLFDFFAHYLFPSELERMKHMMGAQTESYGAGRIMRPITRDDAVTAMKNLLEMYGIGTTDEGKDEADSSPSPETGTDSTSSSPS